MVLNNIINRIKSINSNIKFVGSFDENNQKTGYWEEYYFNGIKDGYWIFYYENGNIRYKGNFIYGYRDGYWGFYTIGGNLWYEANYKNN